MLRSLLGRVWFLPRPVEPVAIHGLGRPLGVGERFRVLSWNIQFGAGRTGWFFYDGGPDVHVSVAEVEDTLNGIGSLVREVDADLVLLQEVDRCSDRTARVDQHARLREALGMPVHGSTPYFKVPYVPVPPVRPLGAVDMHLSVFSRLALGPGSRVALSTLDEPLYRRIFNLRRCLMELSIETDGGPVGLFHTHLSAFSRGDGTLARQVATLLERIGPTAPALLAGDLNSLPPGDDPTRLGIAQILYADAGTPIAPLYEALDPLFPEDGGPAHHSYVPWGSNLPDRTIDYVFGRGLQVHRSEVLREGARWSDHLPIVLEVSAR